MYNTLYMYTFAYVYCIYGKYYKSLNFVSMLFTIFSRYQTHLQESLFEIDVSLSEVYFLPQFFLSLNSHISL